MRRNFKIKLVGTLIILFLFFLCTTLILEFYFRNKTKYRRAGFSYDKELIWKLNPNYHTKKLYAKGKIEGKEPFILSFNDLGFRGNDYKISRIKQKDRVMIMGDSYTAGLDFPLTEIFTGALETLLEESREKKQEVLNISAPAWGTDQQYVFWKNQGLQYKPDLLILVCSPNDLRETYAKNLCLIEPKNICCSEANFSLTEILFWKLANRSCFFQYLQKEYLETEYGNFFKIFEKYPINYGVNDEKDWDAPLYQLDQIEIVNESYKQFEILVKSIQESCIENSINFLLVKNPLMKEFDGTYAKDNFDSTMVTKRIEKIASENNIDFLNLNNEFSKLARPLDLYMTYDGHYNSTGHKFVAQLLLDYVLRNKLIE